MNKFILSLFLFALLACQAKQTNNPEQNVAANQSSDKAAEQSSPSTANTAAPVCKESATKDPKFSDDVLKKVCEWKGHRFTSTGVPDDKGRYSYQYEISKLEGSKAVKTENKKFFNAKQGELEKLLNTKINAEIKTLKEDPTVSDCFEDYEKNKFSLNEMRIEFSGEKVQFSLEFGLPSACFSVDGVTIQLPLKDVEAYVD
jgi:hypothetical protein